MQNVLDKKKPENELSDFSDHAALRRLEQHGTTWNNIGPKRRFLHF
jgi:hypothetical protein